MADPDSCQHIIEAYLILLAMQSIYNPFSSLKEAYWMFNINIMIILALLDTQYLSGHDHHIQKAGSLYLAWGYAQNPDAHHRFQQMLWVSPLVFNILLSLIWDHPVFQNNSAILQTQVEVQLAVTLYQMGQNGNGASIEDIAQVARCSIGSVENFTQWCFNAIKSLHDIFIWRLTPEEKEIEKQWIEKEMGFSGTLQEGYLMYNGTIIVSYKKPGQRANLKTVVQGLQNQSWHLCC